MFVDTPWPWKDERPKPPRRRLSDREQKALIFLIGINLLLLLLAPIRRGDIAASSFLTVSANTIGPARIRC